MRFCFVLSLTCDLFLFVKGFLEKCGNLNPFEVRIRLHPNLSDT
jgi:hypothetical protein